MSSKIKTDHDVIGKTKILTKSYFNHSMSIVPQIKSWIHAARLRTLPLALSGIILASLIAYGQGFFKLNLFLLAIITTLLLQILSNFANDYGDFKHGTDNEKRVGPIRAVQSGAISSKAMKTGMFITGFLALCTGILLLVFALGETLNLTFLLYLLAGILAIIAAIKYTVGQRNYGYQGFGDIMVFVFFGITAVLGTHFLMTLKFDRQVILPATAIGLLSSSVLNVNNMRDIENDKMSGKKTIAVRLGIVQSKMYHALLILAALILLIVYTNLSGKPIVGLSLFFPFGILFFHIMRIFKAQTQKELDPELKRLSVTTLLISIWLGIGLNL